MDALKCLPNLRHLQISFSKVAVSLELDALRGLEEIVISAEQTSRPQQEEIFENLSKAIAQNPGITLIDISGRNDGANPKTNTFQSLHMLFRYIPATAPPLRLRRLRLKSFLLRLDRFTLPHLAHLTSLSLEDIDDPFNRHLDNECLLKNYPEVIQERKRCGSSPGDIWKTLQAARIHLEKITVDDVSTSLLDYLSSYSGLTDLHMEPSGYVDAASSDAMAACFFQGPLESHAQSLQALRIKPHFEGLWCFGLHNFETISRFTRLNHLEMSIGSSDLGLQGRNTCQNPHVSESKPNVIVSASSLPRPAIRIVLTDSPKWISHLQNVLLDTVIDCMPDIESVQVRVARRHMDYGDRCATGRMHHVQYVFRKIVESVNNYAPPPTCQRLPSLAVGYKTLFVGEYSPPIAEQDGTVGGVGSLRYVAKTPKHGVLHWYDILSWTLCVL